VPPELCRSVARPPNGPGWTHEIKFDGYRIQLHVKAGRARLFTRRGLDWTDRFPEIANEGSTLPDCLVDGEVVAFNQKGITDFSRLQDALSKGKTQALVFFAFDLLYAGGADLRGEPLERRKAALKSLLGDGKARHARLRYVEDFRLPGSAMIDAACEMGLEGIVSKRLAAPYRSGRGEDWTKAKCRGGQEVVIGGWWGDENNLRSLLVGAFRGGRLVYLGRVGTGFNRDLSADVLKVLRPLQRARSPFEGVNAPERAAGVRWVEPKAVAEIEYSTLTSAGLLRQASFKGLREDKPARSVVIEALPQAEDERSEAVSKKPNASRGRPAPRDDEVSGIRISHPGKAMWPAAGRNPAVTKLDLARYYEAAAPRILLHVAGRPISMLRAPDGIEGQHFFQRHAMQGGPKFRLMKVRHEKEPYVTIDDTAGLVSLAQAGVLEIHPWGSKKDDPETPARIIFDLDPAPDLGFARVMEAARELRARLERAGLVPFVKTTGGKGLHVVVPVRGSPKAPATWPDAKEFAHELCLQMEKDSPQKYTTTISKKARGGKIFLDYLRNDLTSTAVAPWSPRARPGATISLPLKWSELKTGLDPKKFTIYAATALLRRADPWAGLDASAKSLEAARRKIGLN